MCQSASRVKLILGLASASKVEDLWTTRLGTAYCDGTPFSLIVVALCAMQNSSHLVTSTTPRKAYDFRFIATTILALVFSIPVLSQQANSHNVAAQLSEVKPCANAQFDSQQLQFSCLG